ncbi:cation:proton antiporter domain-containing protein [Nocardiopsis lambiniae]|uniref:Cation:proton antiporter n=1 Tax=Nocardiopsis lambiniae TaxID=3075539 RepID=A0ABU2M8Z1_9ACTN|nr:cation:proton antiporter [Nocardiopsis sp. DSM 44743]MDT0328431.1 cation:proton antiporter [Nocardiopsis sp. DSM 44743]
MMILAAGDTPAYLGPVVALLVAAGLIGALFVRLRVVPIVGFLLAGVVIGPHQLGLVADEEVVRNAADIGVMLLLFTIGVEFSVDRLARIKRFVLGGGTAQVALTVLAVTGILVLFGQDWRVGVFTGFLVALSSTAIVLKVVAAKGLTRQPVGQAAVGTLILQDLAIIVMVLLIPLLGGDNDGGLWGIVRALGTAALVLTSVLLIARKVMPPLLERVARLCSPEIFLLTIVAIALGVAYLTSLAGVSDALGAFLAGMVLSESRHSAHALSEIMPLQMIFSAVFFVSIGMLLDLSALIRLWWVVLLVALAVVVLKAVTATVAIAALRVGAPTAVGAAFLLTQIGEFSFVLQQAGAEYGLTPAGLGAQGDQLLVAVTVVLMTLTPALGALGEAIARRLPGARTGAAHGREPEAEGTKDRRDRVLLAGWGPAARNLGHYLVVNDVPVTVTTLHPDLAAEAESFGHTVVIGEATKESVLHEIGMERVELIVLAENSAEESTHIAHILRGVAPGVPIVVRPTDAPDIPGLHEAEVVRVVDTNRAVTEPLGRTVLDLLGIGHAEPTHPDPTVIDVFDHDPDTPCAHVDMIRPVLPKSTGCTECLQQGRLDWFHLRMCTTCGFVGCCDDSPGRHARSHADAMGHPVIRSVEPGETWAWCHLDSTVIDPARHPSERP